MAQATAETTAAARRGAALAKGGARRAERKETPDMDEPFTLDAPNSGRVTMLEAEGKEIPVNAETATGYPEPPVEDEDDVPDPESTESPEREEDEDDEPDPDETPVSQQALVTQGNARSRVQALLAEALRLGEAHHLIERRSDGSFALPGQTTPRRATSDCTCATCSPHDQRHWWCVVCGAGPHDWLMVKPQYERQTLRPGGIEGARQAACSAQCARDFLAGLGRQPSGVPVSKEIDATLALPS